MLAFALISTWGDPFCRICTYVIMFFHSHTAHRVYEILALNRRKQPNSAELNSTVENSKDKYHSSKRPINKTRASQR